MAPVFAQTGQDTTVFVLSFNIRYDNPADGINAWSNRRERVAGMIRFHRPDVCGFQEAQHCQIEDLSRLLPAYAWCGSGRDDGKDAGEFSPIFYRNDRFQLLTCNTFWLSESPTVPGSKGWDAAFPRVVTAAMLEDRASRARFWVFNTHFDHVGVVARKMSAELLLDSVQSKMKTFPVIITGDFNSRDTSEPYRIMTDGRMFFDALHRSREPHYGPTSTWNGFREIEEGHRIDYIFVSQRIDVLSHAILTDRWEGRFLSDHLPVVARLLLK
ncbi:MAG: endonuclease/exonuclease/phosphatase family protein [Ignavibacteriales bacterium]|nr:endonuclease/exonuclease/phosphatase family protein [Ignavibacteriales bacterium]